MIAIIGAMQEEINAMLLRCDSYRTVAQKPFPLYQGRLASQTVLICQSGIGKASAASTVSYLLATHPVQRILNIGSAGGLRENQQEGDVVLAEALTYYDMLFDIDQPRTGLEDFTFHTDSVELERMRKVLKKLEIRYHEGWIATGDQFIQSPEQCQQVLSRVPQAIAVEMEACAVAQAAARLEVPTLILRSLSDIAVKPGNALAFDQYIHEASARSALFCEAYLSALSMD